MLATQTLREELLALGFTASGGTGFGNGSAMRVRLLDGPRLLLNSPQAGSRYVAVLSVQHLAQEMAAFQATPDLLQKP